MQKKEILHDILGTLGFVQALVLGLRLKEKALMFLGLPCNAHSWMSYSVHRRNFANPFGNEEQALVVNGNAIAYRSALLIILSIVRGTWWMLENPGGSKCLLLPIFQNILHHPLLRSSTFNWSGLQFLMGTGSCKKKYIYIYILALEREASLFIIASQTYGMWF